MEPLSFKCSLPYSRITLPMKCTFLSLQHRIRSSLKSDTNLLPSSSSFCLFVSSWYSFFISSHPRPHLQSPLSLRSHLDLLPSLNPYLLSPLISAFIQLSWTFSILSLSYLLIASHRYSIRNSAGWLAKQMEDRWLTGHQRRLIIGIFWQLHHHSSFRAHCLRPPLQCSTNLPFSFMPHRELTAVKFFAQLQSQ